MQQIVYFHASLDKTMQIERGVSVLDVVYE